MGQGSTATLIVPTSRLNLDATLSSGQTFCWRREPNGQWRGWVGDDPCTIDSSRGNYLLHSSASPAALTRYFGIDIELDPIVATFPQDPILQQALAFAPRLRLLRQPPGETLINFICSAIKQIPHIQAINATLRHRFGSDGRFPSLATLAQLDERQLRDCALGFRARYVLQTARMISAAGESIESWDSLPTPALLERLLALPGVGEKVAGCVMLFAYGRYEVFPIDVWVERVLRQLYGRRWRRPRTPRELREFAHRYFGPHRGFAQQYLFHWVRHQPKAQT